MEDGESSDQAIFRLEMNSAQILQHSVSSSIPSAFEHAQMFDKACSEIKNMYRDTIQRQFRDERQKRTAELSRILRKQLGLAQSTRSSGTSHTPVNKNECLNCKGDGIEREKCPLCNGDGEYEVYKDGRHIMANCLRCGETGYIEKRCSVCNGTGRR